MNTEEVLLYQGKFVVRRFSNNDGLPILMDPDIADQVRGQALTSSRGYVIIKRDGEDVLLHRFAMGCQKSDGRKITINNSNGHDCRRVNLCDSMINTGEILMQGETPIVRRYTNNKSREVLMDHDIAELLRDHSLTSHGKYVMITWEGEDINLHRFVMGCSKGDGRKIDHIVNNGHDCRRSNLRDVTPRENAWNKGVQINNTTGYVGVRQTPEGKWQAAVETDNRNYTENYQTQIEARIAVNRMRRELFGEFAYQQELPVEAEGIVPQPLTIRSMKRTNTTGHKGVTPRGDRFIAQTAIGHKTKYLGMYNTYEEACLMQEKGEQFLHRFGADALFNTPLQVFKAMEL